MKISTHRFRMWLVLFCILTAFVGLFVFVGSSRAEGAIVIDQKTGFFYKTDNPSCLDNWDDWPTSNTRKRDYDWDVSFIPFEYYSLSNLYRREHFMDINGDGLTDYIYSEKSYGNTNGLAHARECVYLNNGHGWDQVYRCYAKELVNSDEPAEYYGDCADTSKK